MISRHSIAVIALSSILLSILTPAVSYASNSTESSQTDDAKEHIAKQKYKHTVNSKKLSSASTTSATSKKNKDSNGITVTEGVDCKDSSPCDVVVSTTKDVLDNLKKSSSANNLVKSSSAGIIEDTVAPKFDFLLMTKYALGNNWKKASVRQQNQLVKLFRQLLVSTYSAALAKFQSAQINITSSELSNGNKIATVLSQVSLPNADNNTNNNQPIKVEYDLARTDSTWKAFDIKIENASLVTTYRNQFNEIIQSNGGGTAGIDSLIKQLRNKNDALRHKKDA